MLLVAQAAYTVVTETVEMVVLVLVVVVEYVAVEVVVMVVVSLTVVVADGTKFSVIVEVFCVMLAYRYEEREWMFKRTVVVKVGVGARLVCVIVFDFVEHFGLGDHLMQMTDFG